RDCQRRDWKKHRGICIEARLYAGREGYLRDGELLNLVLLLEQLSLLDPEDNVRKTVMSLVSHLDDLTPGERRQLSDIAEQAKELYPGIANDVSLSVQLLSMGRRNNFGMTRLADATSTPYAFGTFPYGSLLNHSCFPNCFVTFEGSKMLVFTLCDVGQGEELTIPYCDAILDYRNRQTKLQSQYFFDCDCRLCNWESQSWKNPSSGPCDAPSMQRRLVEAMFEMYEQKSDEAALQIRDRVLSTYPPSITFSTSAWMDVADRADDYLEKGRWKEAAELLEFKTAYYAFRYPSHHIMVGNQAFVTAQALWNAYNVARASQFLRLAQRNLLSFLDGRASFDGLQKLARDIEIEEAAKV
ncbi:SET and MYND domain-containing protein 3, partial [Kappamyces sp. JEL0680]